MMMPIFEEDHVTHHADLLQDIGLLEKLVPTSSSSSSSLELFLIAIFFNFFACLLARALCVGEKVVLLA
jgi:hypothetical protein